MSSADSATRLLALRHKIRRQIQSRASAVDRLDVARSLINDADNDCRWQALIVVGESIETNPEVVWELIREFGVSEDEDMRTGVATVLLEHLLEHHFDAYFPRLKREIENGSELLADTLSRCSPFGQAEARWREVEVLLGRS